MKVKVFTSLLMLILFSFHAAGIDNQTGSTQSGTGQALVAVAKMPELIHIQFLDKLPPLNHTELKLHKEIISKVHLSKASVRQADVPVGPSGRPQTNVKILQSAPSTFMIFKNEGINAIPTEYKITTNEPSVANSGDYVFYTGNYYAARSTDGGSTFSFVDPFADMPTFCCDQDVIYEQSRDIFIWNRMGWYDTNGINYFKLGISNDKGATWVFYNFYPTDVNSTWVNQWWDRPQLALSNNYLYLTSNMFNLDFGAFSHYEPTLTL